MDTSQKALDDIVSNAADSVLEFDPFKGYVNGKVSALLDFGLKLLIAVVVFLVCRKIIKMLSKFLQSSFERAGMETASATFTASVLRAILYVLVISLLATYLGMNGGSVAALIGSVGIGVVLALKESLANIAGGFILLFMKPFVSGDYIHEDNKGNEGTVVKIDLFYTTLLTLDNRTVCIPNGLLSNSSLTNFSRQEKRQIRETVGVSYTTDLELAKKVLLETVKQDEGILAQEPVTVAVKELGEHAVILGWYAWVDPSDYLDARCRITERIKCRFDEQGIVIPYPQLDVYMKKV